MKLINLKFLPLLFLLISSMIGFSALAEDAAIASTPTEAIAELSPLEQSKE